MQIPPVSPVHPPADPPRYQAVIMSITNPATQDQCTSLVNQMTSIKFGLTGIIPKSKLV